MEKRNHHLRFRCLLIALLGTVAVLLSGCASFMDKFGMAVLAAQTVNSLKEHDSLQMTASLDGTLSGELQNVQGPFGLSLGNLSISAGTNTALDLAEVQDPFSLTYDGTTTINVTAFNYSIPITHRGALSAEGDKIFLDTYVGDIHNRIQLDDDSSAAILMIPEIKSMDSFQWFGLLVGVFGSVMKDSFEATLAEQHTDINGQECYVVTIPVDKEDLQLVIESLFSGDGIDMADSDDSVTGGDGSESAGDGSESAGDGSESVGDGSKSVGDGSESVGDGSKSVGDGSKSVGDGSESVGDGSDSSSLLSFDHADWSKANNNLILYISTDTKRPVRAVLDIGTINNLLLNEDLLTNDLLQYVGFEGNIALELKDLKATVDVIQ